MRALVLMVLVVGCSGGGATDGGSAGGGGSATAGGTGTSAGGTGGTAGGSSGGGSSTAGGSGTAGGASGGGTAGGAPFDAGSTPFGALCDAYVDGLCTYQTRCGAMNEKTSCISVFNNRFNPWFRPSCLVDEGRQLDAGRLGYDARAAAACLYALRTSAPCTSNLNAYAPECDRIFTGLVAANGACTRSNECAPTHYCDSTPSVCPGRCLPRKTAGADAGANEECQSGYYVYDGKCRLYALTGLSCAPIAPSTQLQECLPNVAFCNGSACLTLQADGGTCTGDTQCAFPLRCGGNRCVAPGGAGDTCGYGIFPMTPAVPCRFDLACSEGLFGGVCRALGVDGQRCFSPFECAGTRQCPGVFFGAEDGGFRIDAGTCQPPSAPGAPCNANESFCDVGTAYCRLDAGQCTLRSGVGSMAACGTSDECTPPEGCVNGTCRRPYCAP